MIKKQGKFLLILCMILSLVLNSSFVFGNTKQEIEDRENGHEDGVRWGETTGATYGYRDRMNNQRSNWERAYRDIRTRVVADYNLQSKTYAYRSSFQEGFEEGFETGYEKGFKDTAYDSKMSAEEIGSLHGEFFGRMLGEKYGRQDYHQSIESNWQRHMPTDSSLITEYKLRNDSKEYSDAFLEDYKVGFQEEYLYAYRTSNYDTQRVTKENGIRDGIQAGQQVGSALGVTYYIEGKGNSWQRAYNFYENQQTLLTRFLLLRETPQYRLGFVEGFKEGFRASFVEAYQSLNMQVATENVNWKRVSMFEEVIEYAETVVNYVAGNASSSRTKLAELAIEAGTLFRETYIGLLKEEGSFNEYYNKYIPATKVFEVKILNDLSQVQLRKPINLSFEYFGTDRAGIYQLINNQWVYQYSQLENGRIITEIPASLYRGGKYVVLIDDHYRELIDIQTHWARQELYTFLRRGYIQGNQERRYEPNSSMTRGEFLLLLSKVQNWNTARDTKNAAAFTDFPSFGGYTQVIDYAVAKGFIGGYSDNTFQPNNSMSYRELEWVMKKVLSDNDFVWDDFAEKMMYEKYTRSRSRIDKNQHISRGEVVYMLYELQQHKRM